MASETDPGSTPRTLPGARWSCRSCTACCRGFAFGPVDPEVVADLERRDVAAHWPPAAEAPWVAWREGGPWPDGHYLTHRDGHCVFLREDGLCAVHALFGAEAKPSFCREYPFSVVEDPRGPAVVIRTDCGGLPESFLDGAPVEGQVADLLALPTLPSRRTFDPAHVVLLPGLAVSLDQWMEVEEILLRDLSGDRADPEPTVAALRARLFDLLDRPPPPPAAYDEVLADLLARLAEGFEPLVRSDRRLAMGRVLLTRAAQRATWPPLAPSGRDYLHLVLRMELLGKQLHPFGLPAGLGLHLLDTVIARGEAPPPLEAAALGEILPAWKRLRAHTGVHRLLAQHRPALEALFLHAPAGEAR